jgi:DNA-binding transcriptional LysR family regulator
MTYSLEQVRGFVAVADELHFGRAAAKLKMTQPPLSRQIQKLERAVGAQLLARDNRRVTLTPAGQVFLIEARRMLALVEVAPDLARRVSSGYSGLIRIGFTAASAYGLLGQLLNRLSHQLPDLGRGSAVGSDLFWRGRLSAGGSQCTRAARSAGHAGRAFRSV